MSSKTLQLTDALYQYMLEVSIREPIVLKELRLATAVLPASIMQISPEQGQFMHWLAETMGVRKALEVGVFTGYSALSVALALPDGGQLIACDVSDEWASMAREFWQRAGVAHKIDLRIAPALTTLDQLIQSEAGTFDFVFIDADKPNQGNYYEKALTLIRQGGIIALDNVFLAGDVIDPALSNPRTLAMRALNEKLLQDERVSISLVPIGDGLTLVRKR